MLPFELVGRLLPLVPNNAHLAKLLIECDLEGCKTSAFLPGKYLQYILSVRDRLFIFSPFYK